MKPWEKYAAPTAAPTADGPWSQYQGPAPDKSQVDWGEQPAVARGAAGGARGFQKTIMHLGNKIPGVNRVKGYRDEDLEEVDKRWESLEEDSGIIGKLGMFGGEMAALAPVGLFGKAAHGVHALSKTKHAKQAAEAGKKAKDLAKQTKKINAKRNKAGLKQMVEKQGRLTEQLTKAGEKAKRAGKVEAGAAKLASPAAIAAVEGGTAGAILADKGDSAGGAVGGAAGGYILNKAAGPVKAGIAKVSEEATALKKLVGDKFIPLNQATGGGGLGSGASRGLLNAAATANPRAHQKIVGQGERLKDSVFEANLRKQFGSGQHVDDAIAKMKETGDVQKATDDLLQMGGFSGAADDLAGAPLGQQALRSAAPPSKFGRYSGAGLAQASDRVAKANELHRSAGPLREEARAMAGTVDKPPVSTLWGGSSNTTRRPKAVDGLSFHPAEMIASEGFQNFLMGNTKAQQAFQRAEATGDKGLLLELLNAYRNQMAGGAGGAAGGAIEGLSSGMVGGAGAQP